MANITYTEPQKNRRGMWEATAKEEERTVATVERRTKKDLQDWINKYKRGSKMKKQFEMITEVNNIKFYKGNLINNGAEKQQIIFTDDENFRVPENSDLIKECNRIYRNFYE